MPALKWTEEKIRAEAAKYSRKVDFQRGSKACYSTMLTRFPGLIDALFTNERASWTEDNVRAEAAQYKTKTAFMKANGAAYQAAGRLGIIDELFANQLRTWSEALTRECAAKCKTKSEFERRFKGGFEWAQRYGIMNDLGFPINRMPSDNDTIYIWRAVGQHYNGNPVYKIGVTSARLGTFRVERVARLGGFEFDLICCEPVQGKADELERKLHILGEDPKFVGFDGCTEFRALSDSALYVAISMICGAMQ